MKRLVVAENIWKFTYTPVEPRAVAGRRKQGRASSDNWHYANKTHGSWAVLGLFLAYWAGNFVRIMLRAS